MPLPSCATFRFLATTTLPEPEVWPWLSGVLIFGPIGMYLGMVAVRNASASSLGPYTLLRLVIAIIGGVVLFREIPDLLSWLGVAAILSSCLLALGLSPRAPPKSPSKSCSSKLPWPQPRAMTGHQPKAVFKISFGFAVVYPRRNVPASAFDRYWVSSSPQNFANRPHSIPRGRRPRKEPR